jgi:hypothetical protein
MSGILPRQRSRKPRRERRSCLMLSGRRDLRKRERDKMRKEKLEWRKEKRDLN